jgi:hypothetical protein
MRYAHPQRKDDLHRKIRCVPYERCDDYLASAHLKGKKLQCMYHDGDTFRRRDDEEEEVLGVSDPLLDEVLGEDEEDEEEDKDEKSEFGDDGEVEGKPVSDYF